MRPIIEFCSNNSHQGTDRLLKELEENPDYDVIEYGCLGNCGECFLSPYALVNGVIVAGETVDELRAAISGKIKECEEFEDLIADELLD